jgi:hypothetical protein
MDPKSNLDITIAFIVGCFFAGSFCNGLLCLLFTSSNILKICPWFAFTCFFNTIIPLLLKYETTPFFNLVLYFNTT